mgnify:CR=1 FL=1
MLAYYEEKDRGKGIGALLLGPILGLVYVITLPFIAIATIVTLIGKKALSGILSVIRNLVSFGWRPSEAYLSGKKRKKKNISKKGLKEEHMYTLFDFITHIKTVEYIVAISAIGIYIVYWEFLKPKPFKSVVEVGKEDIHHIKMMGLIES